MNATQQPLFDKIIAPAKIQYRIPVYQRNYTWGEENCARLFEDLIFCIEHKDYTHYLGNFVHTKGRNNEEGIKICSIIDGQQRLTTVMLLLKAIEDEKWGR